MKRGVHWHAYTDQDESVIQVIELQLCSATFLNISSLREELKSGSWASGCKDIGQNIKNIKKVCHYTLYT